MSHQLPIEHDRLKKTKSAFTISNPEAQTGLSEVIERGAIPVRYINRYHTNHDIRCAFCDNHTPHRRGFTAEMADGRIALCGIDCGRKYFGIEVAKGFEAALKKTEDEAKNDAVLAAAAEDLPRLHEVVRRRFIPLEREVDEVIRQLPALGTLVLRRQIRDGGDLVITDVETKWVDLPDGGRKPIETEIERGRVHGARILTMEANRFERVRGHCEAVVKGTDKHHRPIRDERRVALRMAITQTVEDGLHYLETARKFLEPANIREFDKAARKYLGGVKIDWKNRGGSAGVIRVRRNGGDWQKFEVPDLTDLPSVSELAPPVREKVD